MTLKNEPPTPKRIRDAYEKGNVPQSRELISTTNFIVSVSIIFICFNYYLDIINHLFNLVLTLSYMDIAQFTGIISSEIFYYLIIIIIPILAMNIIFTIFMNLVNTGLVFSFHVIKPDIKRISFSQGFSKIFSKRNLVEFIKSCVKITILGYLIYQIVWDSIPIIINATHCGLNCIMSAFKGQILYIVIISCSLFIVISVFDVIFQHWHYLKQLRMSKDEVKKEFKETEGDPQIKHKRQQLHQELSMQTVIENVKKSSVIIVNPTHLAVGLYYEKDKNMLPLIQLKGADFLVKFIVEVAKHNNVPVMQNIPLARALYECELFSYIPSELIIPVAEVMRWVLKLKEEQQKGQFSNNQQD